MGGAAGAAKEASAQKPESGKGDPPDKKEGNLKADIERARMGLVTETNEEEDFVVEAKRLKSYGTEKYQSKPRVFLDGLCSPCEDPDTCCIFLCCPLCRIADTWHTIGLPTWLTYWKVFFLYAVCPCLWPCLNFYGRHRVRKTF